MENLKEQLQEVFNRYKDKGLKGILVDSDEDLYVEMSEDSIEGVFTSFIRDYADIQKITKDEVMCATVEDIKSLHIKFGGFLII